MVSTGMCRLGIFLFFSQLFSLQGVQCVSESILRKGCTVVICNRYFNVSVLPYFVAVVFIFMLCDTLL